MRVVLIQNVPSLGHIGEIKEVKEGYGLNYLLPKGLAVLPNDPRAAQILTQKKEKHQKQAEKNTQEEQVTQNLAGKKFVFEAKADDKGKLYGSITPKEIAQKLGISETLITKHFKKTGIYSLVIDFGRGNTAEVKLEIKKKK